MLSALARLRTRPPGIAAGWRFPLPLPFPPLLGLDAAFVMSLGTFVARAARKLLTVLRSARLEMSTLPDPSPTSCAGNWTSWIGLVADSATNRRSDSTADLESMSVRTDWPKIRSSSLRLDHTLETP